MTHSCREFAAGERVRYVPLHAHDDAEHPDCQTGTVTSQNGTFVFVRFGLGATSQACDPERLKKLIEKDG